MVHRSVKSVPLRKFALIICILNLCGCTGLFPSDDIDASGHLSRQDYLALRERSAKAQEKDPADKAMDEMMASLGFSVEKKQNLDTPPLPPEKPALIPSPLPKKTINLSVTETVPLKDVLVELGRKGKLNLEIDPRIRGGILFTAHDRPFDEVLSHICDLAGLRFKTNGKFIRIELDEPYQESYPLDFLSLSRKTSSEVTISTNVFDVDVGDSSSGGSSSSNNGNDNNSRAKISSNAEANFWKEVKSTLPHVLETANQYKPLAKGSRKNNQKPSFSIDKQAGLVTVFGTGRQHKAVKTYLDKLRTKASAQVLIEARIVEVELDDDFQSGINWSGVFKGSENVAAQFGSAGAASLLSSGDTGLFSATIDSGDFSGILNLVRTFGTTRVLSSPRLTVMNNQTAVLKVARNEVYFITSAEFPTTVTASGSTVSGTPVFSSTPRTVPVGLIMTVQPAISGETNRVTLTLRPTISRVVERVADPSIGLNAANAGVDDYVPSKIPVLAVREMDSVLQLSSGEVAIMGGLMQDTSENSEQGVPPFDAMPLLGNLAKSRSNDGKTSELVILLRATILKSPAPDQMDRDLYQYYGKDPRPLLLKNDGA